MGGHLSPLATPLMSSAIFGCAITRSNGPYIKMVVIVWVLVLFQLTVTKTKSTFSKVNIFKLTKTKTVTKNKCI